MTSKTMTTVPRHFVAKNAERWDYAPNPQFLLESARELAKANGVLPAGSDRKKIHLLLIDVQKDFCFPQGSLYAAGRSGKGAIEDSERMARFIYGNLGLLTEITCTLDSHVPYQIFFPSFWLDQNDEHPAPHTVVTYDMVANGLVRPNPAIASLYCKGNYAYLLDYCKHYCKELEAAGKYQLYLWPYHCLLGTDGNALVGVIEEARLFHAFARGAQNVPDVKGLDWRSENYSVLSREVLKDHKGNPIGQRNVGFIKRLLSSDAVIIAGQASSHCVKSTIADLLGEIKAQDPALAKKCYIMRDCMSPVVIPGVADFTDEAEQALDEFAAAGMNVVASTDPVESWPGIGL